MVFTWLRNLERGLVRGFVQQKLAAPRRRIVGSAATYSTPLAVEALEHRKMLSANPMPLSISESTIEPPVGLAAGQITANSSGSVTVTAVLEGTGPHVVKSGDKLASSITALSVAFSGNLNAVPGGANSVTNPSNWQLLRYGVDLGNQITGITFGFDASTNRYIAWVSFSQPLTEGGYQLVVQQTIQDLAGRALDGDGNGVAGGDFHRNFYVAKTLAMGSETKVNTYTTGGQYNPSIATDALGDYVVTWQSDRQGGSNTSIYAQRFSAAGVARGAEFRVNTYVFDQESPSVAMDAAGNFVIAWQSNSQDANGGWGIYAQRYNATGTAQGGEFLVNTFTTGSQYLPTVAMDSTGDFVIAWQTSYQPGRDDSGLGIFAQRYNSAGTAQGGEFLVNTYTTSIQSNPTVAMDAAGDFAIAWQSFSQDGSNFGIYAQRYNAAGAAQGGEFRANTYTTNDQTSPSVAMDAAGDLVITWESIGQDGNGSGIFAQRFDASGTARGSEFRVNADTTSDQNIPSVAMDTSGEFVITWASHGKDGSDQGIHAQRYNFVGTVQGGAFQVNTYTTSRHAAPSVAMDAAGDFVVTWQSFGQDGNDYGVYAQRYQADVAPLLYQIETTPLNVVGTLPTAVTTSVSVFDFDSDNWTGATIQITGNYQSGQDQLVFANTAKITGTWDASGGTMTLTGTDSVSNYRIALRAVQFQNTGPNTTARTISFQVSDGLLYSNIVARAVTTGGPTVTAVLEETGPRVVKNGDELTSSVTVISVAFSDNLNTVSGGANSVTNPSNWQLTRYGVDLSNLISGITFGLNANTHRYTAVVSFSQPLAEGVHQLVARQSIHDLTDRALDGDGDGDVGGDFRRNFAVAKTLPAGIPTRVNTYTTGDQRDPSIAMDAKGDYVVVWDGPSRGGYSIYAQRYNAAGTAQGSEFQVNTKFVNSFAFPAVAMDAAGDFVVTWSGDNKDNLLSYGIFAQRYNPAGIAQGGEFRVNTSATSSKRTPAVAMDAAGDFAITWQSFSQDGDTYGVFAQRYNASGAAQGTEFKVNTYTTGNQVFPSVAMDAAGDFVIAWMSNEQDGNGFGIEAQRYNAAGAVQGVEFQVNTYTTGSQNRPSVAMDAVGDFVITWSSNGQNGNTFGIFAQSFDAAGTAQHGEFKVDTSATENQFDPSVAMDAAGDFVITWDSYGQDGRHGVDAQRYSASGTAQQGQFEVDSSPNGDYSPMKPSVAMDSAGDFVVVWQPLQTLEDGSGYGIYAQRYQTGVAPLLYQLESTPLNVVGSLPTPVTSSLSVFDYDSNYWTGATIQIASNYQSGQDQLVFANTAKITGTWDASTGTMTLTGTDTVSNYRAALRAVQFQHTGTNTSARTISFLATDGLMNSNIVSRMVKLVP